MRKLFVLAFFLSATITLSQDCNYILSGKVIDIHDQTPLAGATIVVAGLEIYAQSDLDGNFQFDELCEGDYILQLSHPECSTQVFKLSMKKNISKTFRLEHHLESLNEIILSGQSYTTKTESLMENNLNEAELESFSGQSLGDALRNLSGVSSLNTGGAIVKPVINGLHSSRITLINNGVRMQDQEWGAEHAPNLDLNTAGRITVLKGASALQYSGDAVGGIIISEPKRVPIKDSLYGKSIFTFASNGRGGSNSTSITKSFDNGWFAQVLGTLKRYGDYEAPDYILSNTGSFERDAFVRFGQNKLDWGWEGHYSIFKKEIAILRASHLGGAEDQIAAINSPVPLIVEPFTYEINRPKQDVTHQVAQISAFKKLNKIGRLSASYDFQHNQRFEYDIRRGDDADKPSVDLKLTTHNFNLALETKIRNWDFKIGTIFNYQENFANPETGVRRLIPDYEQFKIGAYAISNWALNEKWSLEAGMRFDRTTMDVFKFYRSSFWESRGYDELFPEIVVEDFGNQILTRPELSFNNFSGTLGATFEIASNWYLYSNFSLASRAPNASELFSEGLHHSASRIELGDLRFTSEESKKVSFTLQKRGFISFSINPYLNVIDNFIIMEPTGVEQTIRGNFQVWEYRQAPVKLFGLDAEFSSQIVNHLYFDHTFSLTKGYEREPKTPLINMPPVNFSNSLRFEKNRFQATLRQDYVFQQNEFPDTNFEVYLPETETTELVDVSTPPEAYQLWGISATYNFPFVGQSKMQVGMEIQNLFNTSYRDYLNRLRYYADDLGRNIIINTKINF